MFSYVDDDDDDDDRATNLYRFQWKIAQGTQI